MMKWATGLVLAIALGLFVGCGPEKKAEKPKDKAKTEQKADAPKADEKKAEGEKKAEEPAAPKAEEKK